MFKNKETSLKPSIDKLQIELSSKSKEVEILEMNNKELSSQLWEHKKDLQEYVDKVEVTKTNVTSRERL